MFSSDAIVAARTSRCDLIAGSAKLAGAFAVAGAAPVAFRGLGTHAQDATPAGGVAGSPNAQMAEVLATFASSDAPASSTVDPQIARELPSFADAARVLLAEKGEPGVEAVADVSHILIPSPAGDLAARVFTPEGDGPFPVLVYFHGGGWVIANITTYEASCRALANAAGCVVGSIGYRQAPENPFPAAADDAYAAVQ